MRRAKEQRRLVVRDETVADLNPVAEAALVGHGLQLGRAVAPRSTRHDETHVDFGVDEGKRLECNVDALVRADRAERQKEQVRIPMAAALVGDRALGGRLGELRCIEAWMERLEHGHRLEAEGGELSRWWGACVTIRSAWRNVEPVTCRTPGTGSCGSTLWQITTRAVPLGARRRKYRYGGDITGWSHGRIIASAPNPFTRSTALRHVRGSCQSSMKEIVGSGAPGPEGSWPCPR